MSEKATETTDKPERTFLEVDPALHKAVRIMAAPERENLKDIANEAVKAYLAKRGASPTAAA